MKSENAIELRNISLTYDIKVQCDDNGKGLFKKNTRIIKNKVLNNISLDVKKGEILGIIGINGSGKSTLLSIIARIQEPDEGTVEINGKVATILELGMGFHQDLSGRDNIILKGELYGFSKKEMTEKMESIIDYSGIRKYIDNPIRTYSSGMRSRLAFSIMIHVESDIMLVDEILSTGDASFSMKAKDYFKKTMKDGRTVVFVSHSPGQMESFCSRIIWIDKGKIIADGSAKKICAKYNDAIKNSPEILKSLADSGVSEAQYKLGLKYRDGIDVESNSETYVELIRKAAEQGYVSAQVELGDILVKSGDDKSIEEAKTLYQSASTKGNILARQKLSMIYCNKGIRTEYNTLKNIFLQMAERGNPTHMLTYAKFLYVNAWDETDKREMFSWYKRLADEFNHPSAIYQLALLYRDGIGTKKDKDKYIEYLKMGVESQSPKCISLYATELLNGTCVEINEKTAFELNLRCAKIGMPDNQYKVAIMLQEGIGTEINIKESEKWFSIYSKNQLNPFFIAAGDLLKTEKLITDETAETMYLAAADNYDYKAFIKLYSLYLKGKFVNYDLAMKYCNLAAEGSVKARVYRANHYYNGDIVEKDLELASNYYWLARCSGNSDALFRLYLLNKDDEKFKKYLIISAKSHNASAETYINNNFNKNENDME